MIITRKDEKNAVIQVSLEAGDNFSLLNNMPGFKKWVGRELFFRPTNANILYINRHWPEADWNGEAQSFVDQFIAHQQLEQANLKAKAEGLTESDDGYAYKRPPMDHQRKGFLLTREKEFFGLFCEAGTGKTKIIWDTAAYLYAKGEISGLAIVAWPNGVHRNWIETEMPEDMPDWCPVAAAYYSSNLTKTKVRELDSVVRSTDKLRILAYAVESFASEKAQQHLLGFLATGRILLVIDQSACIKNPAAKRTKFFLKKAAPLAAYRRILDGDPNTEGAQELYSQFTFLSSSIIGLDTWSAFKNEYCNLGYFNEIKGLKNQNSLRGAIDAFSYRVLEKDCLDLPERIYKRWRFDLSPEELRIYLELKDEAIAEFAGEQIMTTLPIVAHTRMQQVASGWWPGIERKQIESQPSRLAAFLACMQDCGPGKKLIYARFRRDIQLIQQTLGARCLSYYGAIKEDDRAEAKIRFQEDPEIEYLVGQQQTLGIGHTLTAAEYVIYYSNHPSLRYRTESEKRAHRQGQTKHVKVIDLLANGTKDEKVLRNFKLKKDVAESIMGDPRSFFLED